MTGMPGYTNPWARRVFNLSQKLRTLANYIEKRWPRRRPDFFEYQP